ncbi:MAG: hypothetical protein ACOY93_12315 [Bacillota bacterium]
MPRVWTYRPRRLMWGLSLAAGGLILGFHLAGIPGQSLFPLLVTGLWMPPFFLSTTYLLLPGALLLLSGHLERPAVPLAVAAWSRHGGRWAITWSEGRRERRVLVDDPGGRLPGNGFEPDQEGPRTEAEVRKRYPVAIMMEGFWWLPVILGLAFGSQALVIHRQEVLWYLPLLALPWIALRLSTYRYLVLEEEQLWYLQEGKEPHPIPLAQVTGIEQGALTARVRTADPAHPVIPVNPFWSAGLIRHLREHLRSRSG